LKKTLPLLLILLLLLTLVAGAGPAGAGTFKTATVDVSVLNIRSGPGLQHARLTQATIGTVLPVLSEQTGWVQISLSDGRTGWVSRDFVTVRTTAPDGPFTARVTVSVLNVRSGPGTTFSRISTVAMDSLLPVLQRQGDWLQVSLPSGQTGWVAGQYTAAVNIPAAPPPAAPPVSNIPTTPPAQPTSPPSSEMTAVVNTDTLNVRSGPGENFARLATAARNERFPVLQSQGDWLQVVLPSGQTGWVLGTYTLLLLTLPDPPRQPAQPQQPAETQKVATVTASALNARSAPNTSAQVLALLPQGTSLPVLAEQGDWLQVRLPGGQTAWIAGWHTAVSTRETPASPANPGGSAPIGPSSLAGKIIVIDPGHGGTNSGAIGSTGLMEKDLVLDVSLRAAAMLRQAGATVVLTRHDDSTVSLTQRVGIAGAAGGHAFVSIHANAHPNRDVGGTETYYFRNRVNSTESYYLAAHLQNELVRALGLRSIGVKHGNFYVIRETSMPAVLVELAFLSNRHEESLMRTNQFRESSALAVVRGLERFFRF
jgi:N-acetylmuramoyl-L-alanine amidase